MRLHRSTVALVPGLRRHHDRSPRSPAEYVGFIRFCTARDLLHAGHTVTEAATASGFGNSEALRRAFVARLGISPQKYQQRFRSTGSAAFENEDNVAVS